MVDLEIKLSSCNFSQKQICSFVFWRSYGSAILFWVLLTLCGIHQCCLSATDRDWLWGGCSQSMLTSFWHYLTTSPLHWHFLPYIGWQKAEIFDYLPPSSCRRSLGTTQALVSIQPRCMTLRNSLSFSF